MQLPALFLALVTPIVNLVPSLFLLYVIRSLDPVEREPWKTTGLAFVAGTLSVVPVFIVGGLIAPVIHVLLASPELIDFWETVIEAPLLEELSKFLLLALLVFFFGKDFDSLVDFVVYACAVAIGFEFVENTLYQWSMLLESDFQLYWIHMFNERTIGTAGFHLLFSAWNGFAIWLIAAYKNSKFAAFALPAMLLAIFLHGVNNLGAYLSSVGPQEIVMPINSLGGTIYNVGQCLSLSLFIGLIGAAVMFDIAALGKFSLAVANSGKISEDSQKKHALEEVSDPFHHYISRSFFVALFASNRFKDPKDSLRLRRFAKNALKFSRLSDEGVEARRLQEVLDNGISLLN